MGVKIGQVVSVEPIAAEKRVKLIMDVSRNYKLPVGSSFTVVTTGLVGDKSVEVLPPEKMSDNFLEAGDEVKGNPPASLDAIFTEAQGMMHSARELIEDQELRQDIKQTVHMVSKASVQMESLFKDIKQVTSGFAKLTGQTESLLAQINGAASESIPEIQGIVGSVRRIAGNVESFSGRVNEIANDPQMLNQTRASINNVESLTRRWNVLTDDLRGLSDQAGNVLNNADAITQDIREITSDREIKSNVKTVARNASRLTNAVLNLADPESQNLNKMNLDMRTEAMGVASLKQDLGLTPGAQVNFNVFGDLGLDIPVSYFRLGLDAIGETNLINLQAGSEIADGSGILRFGLVRGRIGAGTDLNTTFLEQPLTISGELYDINSPRMRLGVLQNIYDEYGVSFYWDNQFLTGLNEFSLGFRWQPGNKKEDEPVLKPFN